jgi:thioesterase DpgC
MAKLAETLRAAGMAAADAGRPEALRPALGRDLEADWGVARPHLQACRDLLRQLPPRPRRSGLEQQAAAALLGEGRAVREALLRRHAPAIYARLTAGRTRLLRMVELAWEAAAAFPGLVPDAAEVAAEQRLPMPEQDGVQIDQGLLFSHLLADPASGLHLLQAMGQPTPAALERLPALRAQGRVALPQATLERIGARGHITFHNQAWLNAEDDETEEALETLVDLVLLDDAIQVGVLRGGPMTKAKYAGRRIFGAGINLTRLYQGQISLVRFMLQREAGPLTKVYRGLARPEPDRAGDDDRLEKPFIGAVDGFAIGGHCQLLLVLDRVIAERGAYFNLPARKEGIVPGLANLRLPRFVGERATRQGIFFNRAFPADGPEGRQLCDQVVDGDAEMEAAIDAAASELLSAGATSLTANRRALRVGAEPLDLFRRYLATYAREQADCLYSPALVDNLVRHWNAPSRPRVPGNGR